MGIIKTVGEVALDRMNECTKMLAEKHLQSVRPIYGSTESDKPVHIGSCILLDYQDEKLLLTAAHVIDNNYVTTLYVGGATNLVLLTGDCLTSAMPSGDRKEDKIDVALVKLPTEVQEKLGNVHYIPEADWNTGDLPIKDRCCMCLGFPNSKNKRVNHQEKTVEHTPFIYTSNLKRDVDLFQKTGGAESSHYLLDYCGKHSKSETNDTVNSIHPRGVSGGGLFLIEEMWNPNSYKPGTPCTSKLLGVLIEFHKEQKVLMFTKMSLVQEALSMRSAWSRTLGASPTSEDI
jgi:hypothetical protein